MREARAIQRVLVTGGAGFIGSNFVQLLLRERPLWQVLCLDKLTYAGNMANLETCFEHEHFRFVRGDICDPAVVAKTLAQGVDAVINFAAESHVDRSIDGPEDFIRTNVMGTFHLLEEVRRYWSGLSGPDKDAFRFLHVSTDEVYGSLNPEDPPFHETTPYAPNSPYAASKAASDHLVRAYVHTYGLPAIITNCSNNYGPSQFPEKLIPLVILNAVNGKPLPIYGDGLNIRDWLYVADHCEALAVVFEKGVIGEIYNIGGNCEKTNLDVVTTICNLLDKIRPESPYTPHTSLITYVKDRPGHDRRYAIDASKIAQTLAWTPRETFDSGLEKTIHWYLDNPEWVASVQTGAYREWIQQHYGEDRD